MISGIFYMFFGLCVLPIPVIGWIMGWFIIIGGFFKFVAGVVKLVTPAKEVQTIYIKEASMAKNNLLDDKPTMADELQKLYNLFEKGHISENEFMQGKQKIINSYRQN